MADILPFKKPATSKKKPPDKKHNVGKKSTDKKNTDKKGGSTLCLSGFHKWKVDNSAAFAVKEGKLLTRYVCERCGKTKTETT